MQFRTRELWSCNRDLLQVEKQLDFRAEREGRDKKERDEKKRAFKNLVSLYHQNCNT